jgi:hypothetical protein
MVQCSLQKFAAEAATLLTWRDKQLRKEPQVTANPTEREANDLTCILGHPKAVGFVPE